MGMVLFTESGSFKPSDYGLSAGDAIQVIAVGGGPAAVYPAITVVLAQLAV